MACVAGEPAGIPASTLSTLNDQIASLKRGAYDRGLFLFGSAALDDAVIIADLDKIFERLAMSHLFLSRAIHLPVVKPTPEPHPGCCEDALQEHLQSLRAECPDDVYFEGLLHDLHQRLAEAPSSRWQCLRSGLADCLPGSVVRLVWLLGLCLLWS